MGWTKVMDKLDTHPLGDGRYDHQGTHRAAPGCVITRWHRSTIPPRYALPDHAARTLAAVQLPLLGSLVGAHDHRADSLDVDQGVEELAPRNSADLHQPVADRGERSVYLLARLSRKATRFPVCWYRTSYMVASGCILGLISYVNVRWHRRARQPARSGASIELRWLRPVRTLIGDVRLTALASARSSWAHPRGRQLRTARPPVIDPAASQTPR